jgi:type I restriction enzyme M protein
VPPVGEDIPPLPQAVAEFKQALARCREAEDHLRGLIKEGGWLS